MHIKEEADGHSDWLKSDSDLYDKDDLEKSRQKLISSSIVKVSNIESAYSMSKYSDVKEAHLNTIIGLDQDKIYKETPQFKSVTDYEMYRQQQMGKGLSEQESLKHIANIEQDEKKNAIELSYQLLKRDEEMKRKQKEFNSRFLMLST